MGPEYATSVPLVSMNSISKGFFGECGRCAVFESGACVFLLESGAAAGGGGEAGGHPQQQVRSTPFHPTIPTPCFAGAAATWSASISPRR